MPIGNPSPQAPPSLSDRVRQSFDANLSSLPVFASVSPSMSVTVGGGGMETSSSTQPLSDWDKYWDDFIRVPKDKPQDNTVVTTPTHHPGPLTRSLSPESSSTGHTRDYDKAMSQLHRQLCGVWGVPALTLIDVATLMMVCNYTDTRVRLHPNN